MRFSREVRTFASVLFVIDEIMFLPIVIYVPSLAFNQVTGINLHIVGTIVCMVCVFYTVLGGIKAVVYTDTWQIIVMFLSVALIVTKGTISLGGPGVVFRRNSEGGRIILANFSLSMYQRHTVPAVVFGGIVYWTAFNGVNQTMVQRYLSLTTERNSKISVLLFTVGVSVFISMCVFLGCLIYGTYYKCDPLSAGRVQQEDQLLPLYVMEIASHLIGVPGLFIAGVFGAALSSLSVVLNSTSAVILEDFVRGCLRIPIGEARGKLLVKVVVLILGAMSLGFLFLVEHMGGILVGSTTLTAVAAGTTFGVFTLGMLIPWSTSIGAIVGGISGAVFSSTIAFGGQYAVSTGLVVYPTLPVSVENCWSDYGINATLIQTLQPDESHIFPLFRLAYHWITPLGIIVTVFVGTIASFVFGKNDIRRLDPEVISPIAHWLLPPETQRYAGSAIRRVRERIGEDDDFSL